MSRISIIVALVLLALVQVSAFSTPFVTKSPSLTRTCLSAMTEKEKEDAKNAPLAAGFTEERGVSVDQDGKSNVWAIEPKVELSGKTNEEMTKAGYIAVGGLGGFAILAFLILSNLPDPNNY